MSAHLWDETESTRTITAFGDLDEGIVAGGRQHARRRLIVKISCALIAECDHRQAPRVRTWITNREDVIDLTGADERIDLGHLSLQLIAIALDQAPGHDQARRLTSGFQARCFQDRFDRFLLGRLNEPTGVHHYGVRLCSIRRKLVTVLLELA